MRFITSYSVTLTDGSSVASALVTEIVFSGMGPLYAPVGSTEPVSSVEPIQQDFEVVKTVGTVAVIGLVAVAFIALGPTLLSVFTAKEVVTATSMGAALLMVE
ncbi:hypothetical protein [Fundicoccus ignavus]|uniref:Uncharacterized protein n=1 Tax=Fundicoccus ignavus TaxID=2664442 RepID=A0A844C6E5_9LACT|nr:hypothetical protein [Fundicoccus ignavus]MRJ46067.1 hypothetical protein [Fundicoccus ignavus]